MNLADIGSLCIEASLFCGAVYIIKQLFDAVKGKGDWE